MRAQAAQLAAVGGLAPVVGDLAPVAEGLPLVVGGLQPALSSPDATSAPVLCPQELAAAVHSLVLRKAGSGLMVMCRPTVLADAEPVPLAVEELAM